LTCEAMMEPAEMATTSSKANWICD
jgi:hypothetical protein